MYFECVLCVLNVVKKTSIIFPHFARNSLSLGLAIILDWEKNFEDTLYNTGRNCI